MNNSIKSVAIDSLTVDALYESIHAVALAGRKNEGKLLPVIAAATNGNTSAITLLLGVRVKIAAHKDESLVKKDTATFITALNRTSKEVRQGTELEGIAVSVKFNKKSGQATWVAQVKPRDKAADADLIKALELVKASLNHELVLEFLHQVPELLSHAISDDGE